MNYLSMTFAVFVSMLLVVYYAIPAINKSRYIVLLIGSVVFYCSFGFEYLPFLLFTAFTTYVCARYLKSASRKKLIFIFCVVLNAGIWFVIKIFPWMLQRLDNLIGGAIDLKNHFSFNSIIPIGISYYTLQATGYLIDVYKGRVVPEKSFLKYLLFISFFPSIVQGPISKYDNLMPQLLNNKRFSFELFRKCMVLVLIGIVKKMVIADRLAIFVDECFNNYKNASGVILYLGVIFYSLQLYLDFSGCVDICRGVSGLFNVNLMQNFNRPYLSKSNKEFWSKWHISLSSWLKEYIYIPLGGNRKGEYRKYLNIFITFIVSGIWHGTGFRFLLWGGIHAAYQIGGELTKSIRNKIKNSICIKNDSLFEKIMQVLITFNLVSIAWIPFRANSIMNAKDYFIHMVTQFNPACLFNGDVFGYGINRGLFLVLVINLIVLLIVNIFSQSQESAIDGVIACHPSIRWGICMLLIFDVLLFGVYGQGYELTGFLYGVF